MKLDINYLDVKLLSRYSLSMPETDLIDRIREQWSRERPELDSGAFAIAGRLQVLGKLLERRVASCLAPLELSPWAFDVLATLRRQGAPYSLSPTELSHATMLTSGAMTNRLDRLESGGLVRREPDPSDRRGVRVALTDAGRELTDRAIEARFEEARSSLTALSAAERGALEELLRRLLVDLERDAGRD